MGNVYPDSPLPSEGIQVSDEWGTVSAGPYPSGAVVVGKLRDYPLYSAKLVYPRMSVSEMQPLLDLYRASKGRYGTFAFFDFQGWDTSPVGIPWVKLYVGVGNGVQTIFDLPMKSATSRTVYVNGSSTAYTFGSGLGTDGRDLCTFSSPPTNGHIIELSATGRRAVQARFASDVAAWADFSGIQRSMEVSIVEAR